MSGFAAGGSPRARRRAEIGFVDARGDGLERDHAGLVDRAAAVPLTRTPRLFQAVTRRSASSLSTDRDRARLRERGALGLVGDDPSPACRARAGGRH
jgi:hypothetical protein